MVAVSRYSAGTGALGFNASHYNVLSTIEWLLNLPPTATGNDSTAAFPALKTLFAFPPNVTATFAVTGSVLTSSGTSVGGAVVYANNTTYSNQTVSTSSGAFSIRLPNGSFQLTAVAVGFASATLDENGSGMDLTGVILHVRSDSSPMRYAVSGAVTDPLGGGISGALVFANSSTSSNSTLSQSSGAFRFDLLNGTFLLTAMAAGFEPATVSEMVQGLALWGLGLQLAAVAVPVPAVYTITFTEAGLPPGTLWTVSVGSDTRDSVNATISFSESNGSYAYSVEPVT
jgi:hypothetical protein